MAAKSADLVVTPEVSNSGGVEVRRSSIAKESSGNVEEIVLPRYRRASIGSCHDFCKYGQKHAFEVKKRHSIAKIVPRDLLPRSSEEDVGGAKISVAKRRASVDFKLMKKTSVVKLSASIDTKPMKKKMEVKLGESVNSEPHISITTDSKRKDIPTKLQYRQKQVKNEVPVNRVKPFIHPKSHTSDLPETIRQGTSSVSMKVEMSSTPTCRLVETSSESAAHPMETSESTAYPVETSLESTAKPVETSTESTTKAAATSSESTSKLVETSSESTSKPVETSSESSSKPVETSSESTSKLVKTSLESTSKLVKTSKSTAKPPKTSSKSIAKQQKTSSKSTKLVKTSSKSTAKLVETSSKSAAELMETSLKSFTKNVEVSSNSIVKKVETSPKSTVKKLETSSKSMAKKVKTSSKSMAKKVETSSKSTVKKVEASPKSTAKKVEASPKSTAKKVEASPKSTVKKEEASPKSTVKKEEASPKSTVKKVEASSKSNSKVEDSSKTTPLKSKQLKLSEKHVISSKSNSVVAKQISFMNPSEGSHGQRNSDLNMTKSAFSKVAARRLMTPLRASLPPKPSLIRVASIKARNHKSLKIVPHLKSQLKSRRDESEKPGNDEVEERTLYVIKTESGNKTLQSNQNLSHDVELSPPQSLSPPKFSSSSQEDKEESEYESKYTTSEVEEDSFSVNLESERMEDGEDLEMKEKGKPRKREIVCSAVKSKLNYRRGKLVEFESEKTSPRKLKFPRATIFGENANVTAENQRQKFKRRYETGVHRIGTTSGPDKVVLRRRGMQGKKDVLGLFNNVIEETANKLAEIQKSKVKALVGAFETVISLQES